MTLTASERRVLSDDLCLLASRCSPEERLAFDRHRRALELGFQSLFPAAVQAIEAGFAAQFAPQFAPFDEFNDEILDAEACREVESILALYGILQRSFDQGVLDRLIAARKDQSVQLTAEGLRFPGYSSADEANRAAYARFISGPGSEYESLAHVANFASDVPRCEFYKGMLKRWTDLSRPARPDVRTIVHLVQSRCLDIELDKRQ